MGKLKYGRKQSRTPRFLESVCTSLSSTEALTSCFDLPSLGSPKMHSKGGPCFPRVRFVLTPYNLHILVVCWCFSVCHQSRIILLTGFGEKNIKAEFKAARFVAEPSGVQPFQTLSCPFRVFLSFYSHLQYTAKSFFKR